ncbi:MAG: 50S ribosomal protein L10 [Chloroflexi bacterium]|nr:50S ribosomal protein L10 [Chloroflexota bacterium]
MPSQENVKEVAELGELLAAAPVVIATGYRGMKVAELVQLRKQLRAQGLRYRTVKNTLARLAAEQVGKAELASLLRGPTALALGSADPVASARTLLEFIRSTKLPLEIYGGLIDGHRYSSEQIEAFATLPPREVLLGQVLGSLQAPLTGLLGVLSASIQNFLWLLQARVQQLGGAHDH